MDPQANLTVHVDKRPDLEGNTLTNLMVEDKSLDDLVQPTNTENMCVVPSDTSLAGVEQVLANRIGRETILREALEKFGRRQEFDFLLLDCPPSLGVLSANALVAAEHVVIPMQAQYLSLQGMAKLIEVIQLVQRRLNPTLDVALLVPCMVDSRTNLSAEVLGEIEQHFGQQLARTRIRNNVKLAEAPSFGRTIFEHAPESNGARDYASVADELLQRLGVEAPARDAAEAPASEPPAAADGAEPASSEAAAAETGPTETGPTETGAADPGAAESGDDAAAATAATGQQAVPIDVDSIEAGLLDVGTLGDGTNDPPAMPPDPQTREENAAAGHRLAADRAPGGTASLPDADEIAHRQVVGHGAAVAEAATSGAGTPEAGTREGGAHAGDLRRPPGAADGAMGAEG
jgi:chromosome partitioning protein